MNLEFIIGILSGILFFGIFLIVLVKVFRKIIWQEWKKVLLKIKVSHLNEKGPLVAEQIFASLHGILHKRSIFEFLMGKEKDHISCEIVNINQKLQFYVWCPYKYKNLVESQFYAQYPDIEIEEVEDYIKNLEENGDKLDFYKKYPLEGKTNLPVARNYAVSNYYKKFAVGAELSLENPHIYPIKRFPQFEDKLARMAVDPIAGITAAIGKLNAKEEQAWLQIVIQPIGDNWRKRAKKALRIIESTWMFKHWEKFRNIFADIYLVHNLWWKIIYSPLYFLFWVLRGFRTVKINEGKSSSRKNTEEEIETEMSRTHDRETEVSAAIDKVGRLAYKVNIRLVYLPLQVNLPFSEVKLKEIAGSFKQFNLPYSNGFKIIKIDENNKEILSLYQKRKICSPFVLNTEELATIYHLPNILVQTPNIDWVTSRKLEPPSDLPTVSNNCAEDLVLLGKTNFRGHMQDFGIKIEDRRRHIYIIGKTGMGKTTLLENMIFSDIMAGKGVAVVDPHGDLADRVVDFIPRNRTNDTVIFDPSDTNYPVSFNMLECKVPEHRTLVASGLLGVFKKMYAESWGPRLEHILRNTILALLEYPNTTMLGIMRILVDKNFRRKVVNKITNPLVKSFWEDEFEKMNDRFRTEAVSPIQNKVGQFLSSPVIRNIVGQPKSSIDVRFAMDRKKIFIVNLSKGRIGEDNSSLLGSMMITKFQLDAMSRADIKESERIDFHLYVDEFQNFATDSFATILSEARKYKLNLTMANQYIAQMPEEVRDAVFGNVGTLVAFQVGFDDAEYFSTQFAEEVLPNDIISLPKYHIYTRLLIDGMPSKTFSANTLPPPEFEIEDGRREKVIRISREKYSKSRELVEDKIKKWTENSKIQLQGKEIKKLPKGKRKKEKEHKKNTNENTNATNKEKQPSLQEYKNKHKKKK